MSIKKQMIDIAYCVNRKMLNPLCVSVYSVAANIHSGRIWIFHSNLLPSEQEQISLTISPFPDIKVNYLAVDTEIFDDLEGLHGEVIPFVKLLIPEMIDGLERVIYLDADTVVVDGLADLYYHNLSGHTLGAVSYEDLSMSLEKEYFAAEGLDLNAAGFNSGVMLIDVEKWKNLGLTSKLISEARNANAKYGVLDQPVLNKVFYQKFCQLRIRYNKRATPGSRLSERHTKDGIIHFVGIPKPWDFGGEWLNKNYKLYANYQCNAGIYPRSPIKIFKDDGIFRVLKGVYVGLKTIVS